MGRGSGTRLPRLVIAAPASGHGKTTVSSGLMAALRLRGEKVAGFKVGPDYIDPGYHVLATGRPSRNLDPVLCGENLMVPLLLRGALVPEPADVAIIEGVMGLFDGKLGAEGYASTAHLAELTRSPVVLVVDISHTSRTVAAWVHGLATFDPRIHVAGVILNKSGSPRHAGEATRALEAVGVPVLGVLPRDAGIQAPSRHLGLVPVAEREQAADEITTIARLLAAHIDLEAIQEIARTAPDLDGQRWNPETVVPRFPGQAPVVAVAGGRAFTFQYPEIEELLAATGCRVVRFDPLEDPRLPDGTAGLYLGGGFPEVHAEALAQNRALTTQIRERIGAGLPTIAECAGMLYLAQSLDEHPMAGVLPTQAAMHPRLQLGYRTGIAAQDTLLAAAGTRVQGHEFHRTRVDPPAGSTPAWLLDGRPDGFATPNLHASYLHLNWAGSPQVAERFARAVHHFACS